MDPTPPDGGGRRAEADGREARRCSRLRILDEVAEAEHVVLVQLVRARLVPRGVPVGKGEARFAGADPRVRREADAWVRFRFSLRATLGDLRVWRDYLYPLSRTLFCEATSTYRYIKLAFYLLSCYPDHYPDSPHLTVARGTETTVH